MQKIELFVFWSANFKDVFTPTIKPVKKKDGKVVLDSDEPLIIERPYINDLLFVYDTYQRVKECVDNTPKFQFRYFKSVSNQKPVRVPEKEMEYFRAAVVMNLSSPKYLRPEELITSDFSKRVRIIGGRLNGYEGKLLKRRRASLKRLVVAPLASSPLASILSPTSSSSSDSCNSQCSSLFYISFVEKLYNMLNLQL